MKNYQTLMTTIKSGRDAQHAAFGTHFAKDIRVEDLSKKAAIMLKRCAVWAANWKEIQEGIKPELDEIRSKQLKATAEKFLDFSEEQMEAVMEEYKRLRSESSVA